MKKWLAFIFLLLLSPVIFAIPFSVIIKSGTTLPTSVIAGQTVTAYYTVQNKTASTRINNFVKYLPPNVTQVTAGGTYGDTCAATFTLTAFGTAGDSCTLQLTVSGPVSASDANPHHHLFVCMPGSVSCAGTQFALNVSSSTLLSITVTPANPSVPNGASQQFTATGHYSGGETQDITSAVTWSSSNPAVATITAGGLATAVATSGTSTITATSGSISGSTILTANDEVLVSIAVTPVNPSVPDGLTQQFTATGTYSDSSTFDITTDVVWASTDTGVATINASTGLATVVAPAGSTTISATQGAISGATTLSAVEAVLQSITVTPANPSVPNGTTQQFTATGNYSDGSTQDLTGAVTWASATPAVATISAGGLATAVASTGTSVISATSGAIVGSTTLTAIAPILESIAVTPANPSVPNGLTQQFIATGTYSDSSTQNITGSVTWDSATPAVATITAGGLATAVASSGTSVISATSGAIVGSTTLTAIAPVLVSIAVTPSNPAIAPAATQQFTATGTYSDSSTQDLTNTATWASTSTATATIDATGLATAGGAGGTTTISATSGLVEGSTTLTVVVALMAAGFASSLAAPVPLIAASLDGGGIWAVKTITSPPANGSFGAAACAAPAASSTLCIAVGQDNTGSQPAMLYKSTDGGNTWTRQSITGLPATGAFSGASCVGSGGTAICVAVGASGFGDVPLLAVSTDGGSTWATKTITDGPVNGSLNAVGCTGTGGTAICAAGGNIQIGGAGLVVVSTDGGSTWTAKSVTGTPASGTFNAATCTGTGGTAVCAVAGQNDANNAANLAVSTDGGSTWTNKSITGAPAIYKINGVSCTGSGNTSVCITAGTNESINPAGVISASTNGGSTWAVKTISNPPISTFLLNGASCVGETATAICVAVGRDNVGPAALVITSTDGSANFSTQTVSSLPGNGSSLNAVSCTGTTTTTACVAGGQGNPFGFPSGPALVAVTTGGANNWTVKSISSNPSVGNFEGAAAPH